MIDRSFTATWQMRCDRCGRFMVPHPGASWVHVPDSDVSAGDDRERCARCTSAHGAAYARGDYVPESVQGVLK